MNPQLQQLLLQMFGGSQPANAASPATPTPPVATPPAAPPPMRSAGGMAGPGAGGFAGMMPAGATGGLMGLMGGMGGGFAPEILAKLKEFFSQVGGAPMAMNYSSRMRTVPADPGGTAPNVSNVPKSPAQPAMPMPMQRFHMAPPQVPAQPPMPYGGGLDV